MSFNDVKFVPARRILSDEMSMIINVFLSFSFTSDFEE
jgi:hypothetical protein